MTELIITGLAFILSLIFVDILLIARDIDRMRGEKNNDKGFESRTVTTN